MCLQIKKERSRADNCAQGSNLFNAPSVPHVARAPSRWQPAPVLAMPASTPQAPLARAHLESRSEKQAFSICQVPLNSFYCLSASRSQWENFPSRNRAQTGRQWLEGENRIDKHLADFLHLLGEDQSRIKQQKIQASRYLRLRCMRSTYFFFSLDVQTWQGLQARHTQLVESERHGPRHRPSAVVAASAPRKKLAGCV